MAVRHVVYPAGEVSGPADVAAILEAALGGGVPGAPEAGRRGRRAARGQAWEPPGRVAWRSRVTQNSRLLGSWCWGIPRPSPQHSPGGLIPWWVCQGWKRWERRESSRHTSSPGSGHVIRRPHKGFPSLADLRSEVTGQDLGTLSGSLLADQPDTLASPVGMSDVLPSIHPSSW